MENMKEDIRRLMEKTIGEGVTYKEKIAFLKGLKECLSRYMLFPSLEKFKEDKKLEEHNEILEYFRGFGGSTKEFYYKVIENLIEEIEMR